MRCGGGGMSEGEVRYKLSSTSFSHAPTCMFQQSTRSAIHLLRSTMLSPASCR